MDEHDDVHIDPEDSEAQGKVEDKIKKLRTEIEQLRKEKQEYLDGWQRAKADYVNALKRFERDLSQAKQNGVIKAVEVLLPAFDALERAKVHAEVPEGFQAIARQLESAFASLGLTSIGKKGEKFDPILHEAFGQEPAKSQDEDDTVTDVLEQGWKIGDVVIRPAKVRVAHFA